jgi:arylformamidase
MKVKTLHDISRPIAETSTVYSGDEQPKLSSLCRIGQDAPCNMQRLENWTTHLLTHVDAPLHFVPDGASLDQIDLERFVCPAVVVGVDGDAVEADDVPSGPLTGQAVIFRTRNSLLALHAPFDDRHVYISAAAAEALVARGANLAGIDYLSVDRFGDENYPAHRTLLAGNVLALEGLVLGHVEPGEYELVALPLHITGADGSPVRAVLVSGEAS